MAGKLKKPVVLVCGSTSLRHGLRENGITSVIALDGFFATEELFERPAFTLERGVELGAAKILAAAAL